MAKTKKQKEADKAFEDLISLYDIADKLEDDGYEKRAKFVREKLDKVGAFIVKQK